MVNVEVAAAAQVVSCLPDASAETVGVENCFAGLVVQERNLLQHLPPGRSDAGASLFERRRSESTSHISSNTSLASPDPEYDM